MATVNFYQSTGATSGSTRAMWTPVLSPGARYYLHSSGSDAYAGTDRYKPVATLAQAHTNASAGDTIVIMAGHAQTLSASQTFNKAGVQVICEGTGTNAPTFTAAAAISMFDITTAGVIIEGVRFAISTVAPTSQVRIAASGVKILGCSFYGGQYDTNRLLYLHTSADHVTVRDSTFTSSATSVTTQPARGIHSAVSVGTLNLENVTFDGGTYGWSGFAFDDDSGVTRMDAHDISLLNGSRFKWTATAGNGCVRPSSASMASYISIVT